MPTPRPAKKKSSGIEITRTSTMIVATAPRKIVSRLSGTAAGMSTPTSRRATTRTTRIPRKKTIFPAVPVFQPVTDTFTPSPGPVYHPVNADTASTTPASNPIRSPIPSSPRSRMESPRMSRSGNAIGGTVWSIAQSESHPYTPTRGTADA